MYITLPATIIYTQKQIRCPKRINAEAGHCCRAAIWYYISSKHYARGCLVIYMCLCMYYDECVYVRLSFPVDGKQIWKTPVLAEGTLKLTAVLVLAGLQINVVRNGGGTRVMMPLTDRRLYRRADPRSGFFPVYRSWLSAQPLLEVLMLAQEMGCASRHRATTHGPY